MSRKTYSLGAIALAASASLGFSSLDAAQVLSQAAEDPALRAPAPVAVEQPVEIVPAEPVFVSHEVVQPLPPPNEERNPLPAAGSLAELVELVDADQPMSEDLRCLASAVYFESRGEPLEGQLAVAQVIINRSRDGRFPASYCGVVHQRAQFSFVKKGRMPAIRTASAAWKRARAIARIADEGLWASRAGDAVFFHATYVRPRWSQRKTQLARISTHIFYR